MQQYHFSFPKLVKYGFFLIDTALLAAAFTVAARLGYLLGSSPAGVDFDPSRIVGWGFLAVIGTQAPLYAFGQYALFAPQPQRMARLLLALLVAAPTIAAAFFVFGAAPPLRVAAVIYGAIAIPLVLTWHRLGRRRLIERVPPRRVLAIGAAETMRRLADGLEDMRPAKYVLVARLVVDGEAGIGDLDAARRFASLDEAMNVIDYDVLALDFDNLDLSVDTAMHLVQEHFRGRTIRDLSAFYTNVTGRIPTAAMTREEILKSLIGRRPVQPFYPRIKRSLDVAFALLALTVGLPLMALVALAILIDDGRPVLFVQERLGRDKRPFPCLKFRTMLRDAEKATGPKWSEADDPRILRVGRVLRKWRLDELPQLFNVLRGEMSFVGPRAIRRHFRDVLAAEIPFYDLRFTIKPGLTGWSQVMGEYFGSVEEQKVKFEYDMFYMNHMSLTADLYIILRTTQAVLGGRGL